MMIGTLTNAYALTPYGKGMEKEQATGLQKTNGDSKEECQTCKNRKYKDGSNEMVSFKSAAHISPEAAAGRVLAHEGEHVANAYGKAAKKGGKVVYAAVSIHTAVCPECGRVYVSGGTTSTKIQYPNEDNPYQKNRKSFDAARFIGANFDRAV